MNSVIPIIAICANKVWSPFSLTLLSMVFIYSAQSQSRTVVMDCDDNSGGTQNLFRDLPKFLYIGKFMRSSCQKSKIVPSHKIWVQTHILESSNRIQLLEIIEWEKLPLASKFSKIFGTIVISVIRSSGFSIFTP